MLTALNTKILIAILAALSVLAGIAVRAERKQVASEHEQEAFKRDVERYQKKDPPKTWDATSMYR